jgi:hypothetical protein
MPQKNYHQAAEPAAQQAISYIQTWAVRSADSSRWPARLVHDTGQNVLQCLQQTVDPRIRKRTTFLDKHTIYARYILWRQQVSVYVNQIFLRSFVVLHSKEPDLFMKLVFAVLTYTSHITLISWFLSVNTSEESKFNYGFNSNLTLT